VSREAFDTLAATAHRIGIPFAGHVPEDVGIARALEARYATIDHLDGYIEAMLREGSPVSGTIERGKRADLVLLDADPLADIRNTTRRSGVMVRGRWLPRTEIERRLAEVATAVSH
jgi:imidazolonepropionase-like amidohydrolase